MDTIRCARCEFANWASDTVCSRCAAPLSFVETVASGAGARRTMGRGMNVCTFCGTEFEGYFCSLCRKPVQAARPPAPEVERPSVSSLLAPTRAKLGVAGAVVFVVAAAFLLVLWGYGKTETGTLQAELIEQSFDFRTPVTVSFSERGEEVAPGVEVLRELGLVEYRRGMLTLRSISSNVAVWTEDLSPRARGDRVPSARPVQFAEVTLTTVGAKESEGWATFQSANSDVSPWGEARGWRVPLGAREFLEVKGMQPLGEGRTDLMSVDFTWRWRPNGLGRHFDVSGEEFTRLSAPGQLSAMTRHFNDSTKTYTGRAVLNLAGGRWSAGNITFEEDGKAKTDLIR